MSDDKAVAVRTGGNFLPAPANFEEAWRVAKVLAASELVPKDYRDKPENCLVAMQWGADIGLPGLQALQNIAVINGRPSIWGDAAKALAYSHPACESIDERVEGEGDKMVAVCVAKRKGKNPVEQRFSVQDAIKAGLWGKQGPWKSYPRRMLQMRARGFALRDAFPDALRGLILAEEAQDYQPIERDMGAVERVQPAGQSAEPKTPAAYPSADFEKNKSAWLKKLAEGSITLEKLQAMVKSKGELTTEQLQALKDAMKTDPNGDEPANATIL
ncbi:MAG: hypothetical protein KGL35_05950, partial [Bradyrhizobium sp.]|nr:hypothetical protein [Bradyrhizobium sp.]